MLPWLCRFPSIPLSFNLAAVLPRRSASRVSSDPQPCGQRSSGHRLRLGLHGYLIRFAPLAFVSQRQKCTSQLPSPLAFHKVSTDFIPPPYVPLTSHILKPSSFLNISLVELKSLIKDTLCRLQTLYAQ